MVRVGERSNNLGQSDRPPHVGGPVLNVNLDRLASVRALLQKSDKKERELKRADRPEPKPLGDDTDLSLSTDPGGQLFVDGITTDDVKQGAIGDCYFVAALAAVADQNPRLIEDAIKDNGDGTYTVRFFDDKKKQVKITVDADLYHNRGGRLAYGRSTDAGELWVSLMEKAYAQWKGGFDKIGNGGSPAAALRALTGRKTNSFSHGSISSDKLWKNLTSDRAAVALTPGTDEKKILDGTNIVKWHAYTVEGTEVVDGQRFVILRNPWASTELTTDRYATDVDGDMDGALDGNDGEFRISLEDYKKYFSSTEMLR